MWDLGSDRSALNSCVLPWQAGVCLGTWDKFFALRLSFPICKMGTLQQAGPSSLQLIVSKCWQILVKEHMGHTRDVRGVTGSSPSVRPLGKMMSEASFVFSHDVVTQRAGHPPLSLLDS